LGGSFTADSDGNGDAPGEQPTEIVSNGPPTAADDADVTVEDAPVTIDVVGNDTDPDDDIDPASVAVVSGPANGTVAVALDGTVTYTPDANFNGTDSFTYEVCDTGGLCDEATVSVTVTPVNDAPVATDDNIGAVEDMPVTVDVLANDGDPDGDLDPTSVQVLTGPSNGSVAVDPVTGEVTYTPDPNFWGSDSFTYQVCDTGGLCDVATVTLNVAAVNDPPVAIDDAVGVVEDTPVVVPVLANDSDPDGPSDLDPGSVTVTSGPTNGTVSVDPTTGEVTYTPDPNFNGTDTFTYEVCDVGPPRACATATVTVAVDPVNDSPDAHEDAGSTPENTPVHIPVLGNDSDVDGPTELDPASVTIVSGPSNGTVTVDPATGVVTYTPDPDHVGTDTFTYRVCDTGGLCSDAEVTVTTTAVPDEPPANRPPQVVDDVVRRDGNRPIRIDVLSNDSDLDGDLDPTSVRIVSGPEHGRVTVDPETGAITYVPDPGWTGPDSFTYEVCDNDGVCRTATVTIEGTAAGAPTLPDTAMSLRSDTFANVIALALAATIVATSAVNRRRLGPATGGVPER
jgi:hypothetical protein